MSVIVDCNKLESYKGTEFKALDVGLLMEVSTGRVVVFEGPCEAHFTHNGLAECEMIMFREDLV